MIKALPWKHTDAADTVCTCPGARDIQTGAVQAGTCHSGYLGDISGTSSPEMPDTTENQLIFARVCVC